MMIMADRKKAVSAILGPHDEPDDKAAMSDHEQELHAISEELMHAVHGKDVPGIAEALRAAHAHLDMEPHEEGPHEEE